MARVTKLATKPVPATFVSEAAAPRGERLALGELDEHIGYFARRFQVWIFQDLIKALSAADIRISHYSVLVIIKANPGLAQSEVADAVGIEPARLVRVLDELERRGWIERMRSASDRRSHALFLTCRRAESVRAHQAAGPTARRQCDRAARTREVQIPAAAPQGDQRGSAGLINFDTSASRKVA